MHPRLSSLLSPETELAAPAIPLRSEIPPEDTWDLTHLFRSDDDWENLFAEVRDTYPSVQNFKGRVGESAESLLAVLEFEKGIDLKLERLRHYAALRVSEDSSNDDHMARSGKLENLGIRIGEARAFVEPEIQAMDDETFAAFLEDSMLDEWRLYLDKLRRFRPHTLSEPEERLLALAGPAIEGHHETFSQLTDVDMQFGTLTDEKGREMPLSQASFGSFLFKTDAKLRREAFHQFYREFGDHRYTLASALASSTKADVFRARARNHPSALEAALFPDRVPAEVYDSLVETVRGNFIPLYRYFELRRRLLGLDEIHHYDTYVPVVENVQTDISFDEAIELILEALTPLGKDYVEGLGNGLRGRWCDRYESKGKRSGAFSSSSYENPPYILMNYRSDVFSHVYTLAHEAGHSMHSWYSMKNQRFQDCHYPIFLDEVASTFNEELLTHHLLEKTDDPRMRAYIINRQIDDIRATLFRQTMFAEFERVIHAVEEEGDALTLGLFREEYRKLLDAYFGSDFAIDDELELECLRIPHFYHAFYVYKYATGISAAVALSQRVLGGGEQELSDYLGFLKSGGSDYPLETLARAGVDMTSPEPVEQTIKLFERRVGELEELLT